MQRTRPIKWLAKWITELKTNCNLMRALFKHLALSSQEFYYEIYYFDQEKTTPVRIVCALLWGLMHIYYHNPTDNPSPGVCSDVVRCNETMPIFIIHEFTSQQDFVLCIRPRPISLSSWTCYKTRTSGKRVGGVLCGRAGVEQIGHFCLPGIWWFWFEEKKFCKAGDMIMLACEMETCRWCLELPHWGSPGDIRQARYNSTSIFLAEEKHCYRPCIAINLPGETGPQG